MSNDATAADSSIFDGSTAVNVIIQLAAGGAHTCALLQGGVVRCWGRGAEGQLGYGNLNAIGDDTNEMPPADVEVGGTVTQITAGAYHTCALLDTGAVRCWGKGSDGQLGYGSTDSIGDTPGEMPPADVNVGGSVIQIAAGALHTCALLDTRAVRCWGNGSSGQLGNVGVDSIGDALGEMPPADVHVGSTVVRIAAGASHTCALVATAAVACWGNGADGRLGYGGTQSVGDNETPATAGTVPVGGAVSQIAPGANHTCARLNTGGVRCWGAGAHGQLGYGNSNSIGDSVLPSAAGDVNVGDTVVQVVAGTEHTCALLSSGAVKCWGYGPLGQLGYGNGNSIGDSETPSSQVDVSLGGPVVQIATSALHSCALLGSGEVRCWGVASDGQLGYGSTVTVGDTEPPSSRPPVLVW